MEDVEVLGNGVDATGKWLFQNERIKSGASDVSRSIFDLGVKRLLLTRVRKSEVVGRIRNPTHPSMLNKFPLNYIWYVP